MSCRWRRAALTSKKGPAAVVAIAVSKPVRDVIDTGDSDARLGPASNSQAYVSVEPFHEAYTVVCPLASTAAAAGLVSGSPTHGRL